MTQVEARARALEQARAEKSGDDRAAEKNSDGSADGERMGGRPARASTAGRRPWFQSFLAFDPAPVDADVKQPLL